MKRVKPGRFAKPKLTPGTPSKCWILYIFSDMWMEHLTQFIKTSLFTPYLPVWPHSGKKSDSEKESS